MKLKTLITGIVGVPLYIISDKLLENAYNHGIAMLILGFALIIDGVYTRFSRIKLGSSGVKNKGLLVGWGCSGISCSTKGKQIWDDSINNTLFRSKTRRCI